MKSLGDLRRSCMINCKMTRTNERTSHPNIVGRHEFIRSPHLQQAETSTLLRPMLSDFESVSSEEGVGDDDFKDGGGNDTDIDKDGGDVDGELAIGCI